MSTDALHWVVAILTVVGSVLGAWGGVKVAVTRLETQMQGVLEDVKMHERELARNSEDLVVHDVELEQVLDKLQIKRARRQPLRGWDT